MLINIQELSVMERMHWLQTAIAPRPICLASTISAAGEVNLSPFSFFNLFSSAPPIVIFSPSRRGRDNTIKHTLENVLEVPEVVINICDYNMVQQLSLSSCEYPKGIDEFVKSGFAKQIATIVKPPMVNEAKIKLECKVNEVKSLGENAGAGQLVIAEVLCMHVDESILNNDGKIDQQKIEHVARLGGDWYCKINSTNLFSIAKPNTQLGVGVDALPAFVKNSTILTGNNLGQLGNLHFLPEIDTAFVDANASNIVQYYSLTPAEMEIELHKYAKRLLDNNEVLKAWQILLMTGE